MRVNSQKELTQEFSEVPKDTKYTFKFKNTAGKAYRLIEYKLGQGKKLPYVTVIEGMSRTSRVLFLSKILTTDFFIFFSLSN